MTSQRVTDERDVFTLQIKPAAVTQRDDSGTRTDHVAGEQGR